jgi:hypothetical protein
MAVKWNLESDINSKTMEETLIEVFGCISSRGKRTFKINAGKEIKGIKTEFYLAGNAMETMLIEVFGCNSLDGSAIKLETNKDRKRINRGFYPDSYEYSQDILSLPVNA